MTFHKVACLLVVFTATLVVACGPKEEQGAELSEIYIADRGDAVKGNERRRPATADEKLYTVQGAGCTAHLLSPEFLMTAAHCTPKVGDRYTSGSASLRNVRNDITVAALTEVSTALDFAIMRITWVGGFPEDQKFPPLAATKKDDVVFSAAAEEGDKVYTVGFPADKINSWGATFAQGQLKAFNQNQKLLAYNVGIINGNSGGAVWRVKDQMLIAATNLGPKNFGEPGWDDGNVNAAGDWNLGTAVWEVYAVSATMKSIFPEGSNRYTVKVPPPTTKVDPPVVPEPPLIPPPKLEPIAGCVKR